MGHIRRNKGHCRIPVAKRMTGRQKNPLCRMNRFPAEGIPDDSDCYINPLATAAASDGRHPDASCGVRMPQRKRAEADSTAWRRAAGQPDKNRNSRSPSRPAYTSWPLRHFSSCSRSSLSIRSASRSGSRPTVPGWFNSSFSSAA